MATFDHQAIIRQLRNLSTEKLAEILRKRDASEWREEVFSIVERMLAERLTGHKRVAVTTSPPSAMAKPVAVADPVHTSTRSFNETHANAIAIHCSDGRFAAHFDEFLAETLNLPDCDRLLVPGGPVLLAGRLASFWEGAGVENQARFLIEAHDLKRVILIAHEGCVYYSHRLGFLVADIEQAQKDDLAKAAQTLGRFSEGLDIKAYLARRHGDRILFEPVPVL